MSACRDPDADSDVACPQSKVARRNPPRSSRSPSPKPAAAGSVPHESFDRISYKPESIEKCQLIVLVCFAESAPNTGRGGVTATTVKTERGSQSELFSAEPSTAREDQEFVKLAPSSPARSPVKKAPRVEVDMSQDADALFDSLPSRRPRRRNRTPTPEPVAVEAQVSSPARRGRAGAASTTNDDADSKNQSAQRKSPRKRNLSPAPAAVNTEALRGGKKEEVVIDANANIDDLFDSIPTRRGRRGRDRRPSPPPPVTPSNVKRSKSPVPATRGSPRRAPRPEEPSTSTATIKPEPVTPAKPVATELAAAETVGYNKIAAFQTFCTVPPLRTNTSQSTRTHQCPTAC